MEEIIGRQHGLAANKDRFTYDDQERVISQTRTIDGRVYTILTLSFDGLDRLRV